MCASPDGLDTKKNHVNLKSMKEYVFAIKGRYYEKPFTFANLTTGCLTMKDLYVNLKSNTNIYPYWGAHRYVVSIPVEMNQNR